MKKILVQPNSLENLGDVLKSNINGVILPLKDFSVNSEYYFTIDDIKSIINITSKEVCISINRIMHNVDLKELERALVALNKINISKILFYDLAVLNMVKRLGINKELVIFQDHLNASLYSNNFYKRRGVKYSVITNDITIDEINEISKENKLMLYCYGYLPIFYSRRYLITNYLKYIKKDNNSKIYYIKNKDDKYPIVEEDYGTTIYTNKPINLINEIDKINVSYIILNANMIRRDKFMEVVNQYLNNNNYNEEYYIGNMNKKTVYKVEDYEKKN